MFLCYNYYGYEGEEFKSKIREMIEFNKSSYSEKYPVRTLEYKDYHTEIYKNVPNKYDVEEETVINPYEKKNVIHILFYISSF